LPVVEIPPEVLIDLLGIQEVQSAYDAKEQENGDFD
jgi:hypothetical protein